MSGPVQRQFEKTIGLLHERKAKFALAGGYAASLYRTQERFTKDIDLLLWTEGNVIEDAKHILRSLDLDAFEIRETDLKAGPLHRIKAKTTPVWIVAGRGKAKENIPIDFLLHLFPWMKEALERAQENQQDIGFGWKIPVITVEDVLIATFMAFNQRSDRTDDLSDIRDILKHQHPLHLPYLVGRMKSFATPCPKEAIDFAPKVIRTVSKEIRSDRKR